MSEPERTGPSAGPVRIVLELREGPPTVTLEKTAQAFQQGRRFWGDRLLLSECFDEVLWAADGRLGHFGQGFSFTDYDEDYEPPSAVTEDYYRRRIDEPLHPLYLGALDWWGCHHKPYVRDPAEPRTTIDRAWGALACHSLVCTLCGSDAPCALADRLEAVARYVDQTPPQETLEEPCQPPKPTNRRKRSSRTPAGRTSSGNPPTLTLMTGTTRSSPSSPATSG